MASDLLTRLRAQKSPLAQEAAQAIAQEQATTDAAEKEAAMLRVTMRDMAGCLHEAMSLLLYAESEMMAALGIEAKKGAKDV